MWSTYPANDLVREALLPSRNMVVIFQIRTVSQLTDNARR